MSRLKTLLHTPILWVAKNLVTKYLFKYIPSMILQFEQSQNILWRVKERATLL